MRKKIVALLIAVSMACAPAAVHAAEDTDARIAALEERVAALEELVSMLTGPGVSAAPQEEAGEPAPIGENGIGLTANGCTLTYTGFELGKSYDDHDAVIVNFEFTNNSGTNTSALYEYYMKVFQHGREVEFATISSGVSQAYDDRDTEIRSGSEPIAVAFASKIDDTSDIIVNLSSSRDWDVEPIEFTISLE